MQNPMKNNERILHSEEDDLIVPEDTENLLARPFQNAVPLIFSLNKDKFSEKWRILFNCTYISTQINREGVNNKLPHWARDGSTIP